jgi:D-alanine-D-alanine ligase
MKVTVLRGGPSNEREVSLKSGAAVAEALRAGGHDVFESDVGPDQLSALDLPCDVLFPVLHGSFGEDGQLQRILEHRGIRYVGSDARASAIAIDKLETKRHWLRAGLPTPAFHVATAQDPTLGAVGAPCAVKAIKSGSSVGVFICGTTAEALTRVREIVAVDGVALVEEFVKGTEITVGMLEESPLPPIRIVYEQGFFDYQAKYSAGGAGHSFDTGQPPERIARIQADVKRAHDVIGCRDLSRTDVMIDDAGRYFLIEINTMPGFTSRSLLPEAAGKSGVSFVQLVDRLVRRAAAR